MISRKINSYIVLVALIGMFAICVTKLFGTTVSSKFHSANSGVASEVTFGGGGNYEPSKSHFPTYQPRPRPAPAQPSYEPPPVPEAHLPAQVNHTTSTAVDRFSTFALDVDTGSYTLARAEITKGFRPIPRTVRVEEFVNYFDYGYPEPEDGPIAVNLEAAPSPFSAREDTYLLRVGVQAKRVNPKTRKPANLTFLIDVSGSMAASNKLPLVKQSLRYLTQNLAPEDTVSIVTYAGSTHVALPRTSARHKSAITYGIESLMAGGGTHMGDGMKLAYQQLAGNVVKGEINRVIVLSDGDANIGGTNADDMLAEIEQYADKGITMSAIGFGMGTYKDALMEQLANRGNGNYYYIDTMQEARKVFGEQLDGTLQVVAKDVKVQVEFDPEKVSNYRLIGYENRDIADKDFRNDKVDAGEVGAGHSVTALYEIQAPTLDGVLAKVRVRAKEPEGKKASEREFALHALDVRPKLSDASADFMFAASVAAYAEILRKSPYAHNLTLGFVKELAVPAIGNKRDRMDFVELLDKTNI